MTTQEFLVEWHRIVRERDVAALAALLAPRMAQYLSSQNGGRTK